MTSEPLPYARMWSVERVSPGLRAAAGAAVKFASAGFDLVTPRQHGITILIYHRVGGASGSPVDLPVELFRRQMAHLAATCDMITLDEAVTCLTASHPGVKQAVVVTFDDGTTDWPATAMPVLVEFGVPATFYVATRFVDEQLPWPDGAAPVSWAGLAEMVSTGLATIGSHTHSHALLDRVDAAARDEVDRSADLIEARLDRACAHFAYPKALLGSTTAQAEVRRRFASATLAGGRVNVAGLADPYRLWRSPVQTSDGMRWFTRKASGGLRLEGMLRERRSGARYADSMV